MCQNRRVARITFVPYTDSFAKANELSTGCPIQAFFWLEWGRFPIRARTSIKLYLPSISLLNLQRALGIETIPAVQANSLCHFQLLPPLAIALLSSREANIRERTGTRPSSVRSSDLRLRDYAGTRSSAGLRDRAGRPAGAIKSLKEGVSRQLIGEAKKFWQKRYYDFNVHSQRKFIEKLQ